MDEEFSEFTSTEEDGRASHRNVVANRHSYTVVTLNPRNMSSVFSAKLRQNVITDVRINDSVTTRFFTKNYNFHKQYNSHFILTGFKIQIENIFIIQIDDIKIQINKSITKE